MIIFSFRRRDIATWRSSCLFKSGHLSINKIIKLQPQLTYQCDNMGGRVKCFIFFFLSKVLDNLQGSCTELMFISDGLVFILPEYPKICLSFIYICKTVPGIIYWTFISTLGIHCIFNTETEILYLSIYSLFFTSFTSHIHIQYPGFETSFDRLAPELY